MTYDPSNYPTPTNIWESIEYSRFGTTITESLWMFPTFETLHVIALVTVFGSIALVDARLIGLTSHSMPFSRLSRDMLPWTWVGFAVAAITGTLLFASKASSYMVNPFFLWKLGLLALAGINMAVFQFVTEKKVSSFDVDVAMPLQAKLAGFISLGLWTAIIVCGRMIGFTLGICVPGDPNPCPIPSLF